MVTSIEQAKREQPTLEAAAEDAARAPAPAAEAPSMPVAANDVTGPLTGGDAMDFVKDNRIHVKDGSLFIDPYLVIHPRELMPENDTKLREKLRLTYSVNNPSFYESSDRLAIALNLAQLVPVSLQAKHSKLMDEVKKFNAEWIRALILIW